MRHKAFAFQTLDDLRAEAEKAGAFIPISEDLSALSAPLSVEGQVVANRLAIQPMEGCDGTPQGEPGELTIRRYRRFAAGGAGLIWFEAVAVAPEGRANPRQLMLTEKNIDSYKRLLNDIREVSLRENGFAPLIVMQATHSGRYSKPQGKPEPIIAYNNPAYEKENPIDKSCVASDQYLDACVPRFAEAARLGEAAGFDGIDIKACHGYLLNELLSARTRENSIHGGNFENRTRLLLSAVSAARAAVGPRVFITARLNVYDGFAYPYGFGVSESGGLKPDLSEAEALVKELSRLGVRMINVTAGNPYVNPHVNRPYDRGAYVPPESAAEGLGRLYSCVATIKKSNPEMACVASGMSYARHFSPYIAAGLVESGAADIAGFGREAFAYPNFARDILRGGAMDNAMDKKKCCICCGKCSELMRAGSMAGCVARDEIYSRLYKRDVLNNKK